MQRVVKYHHLEPQISVETTLIIIYVQASEGHTSTLVDI